VLFGVAAAFIHLAQLGLAALPAALGIQVALDVVLFIIAVMAGRVIPMFTSNGVPGAKATRHPAVERAALGSVLALLAVDAIGLSGAPLLVVAVVACLAHGWRWALWQPWRTLRVPLVWVLHLAYLWVPIHLLLRSVGELGWVAPSLATHALTVGAAGGLIIGMMTRTARGHTAGPCAPIGSRPLATRSSSSPPSSASRCSPRARADVSAVLGSAALWSAGVRSLRHPLLAAADAAARRRPAG
jgi:uncharacterized protein involved in response to NO